MERENSKYICGLERYKQFKNEEGNIITDNSEIVQLCEIITDS